MPAGDNRLGLIFEIAADPSKAESALSEFSGRANAIEAELAAAKKSLAANQKNYNEALREGDAASKEIVADMAREREAVASLSAELADVKKQMKSLAEAQQGIGGGIRESIAGLRTFRMLMYSSLGLVSFGFYITEWKRIAEAIAGAASSLGGFDAGLQLVMQDAAKMNEEMLTTFGQLNIVQLQQIAAIKDFHQRAVVESNFELQNAERQAETLTKQREGLGEALSLIRQYKEAQTSGTATPGAIGTAQVESTQRMLAIANEAKQKGIDLSANVLDLEKKYVKAQKEETEADKAVVKFRMAASDAATKQGNAEESAAHKREAAAHRAQAAAMKAAHAEAEWNKQFTNLQLHMERVSDRVAARLATHRERLHQSGMAAAPKGPGWSSGGSEGLGMLTSQIAAQTKLNEVQRMALPTEREIAIVRRQLISLYPDLTKAEIGQASVVAAADAAIRRRISLYGEQAQITKQLIGFMREYYGVQQQGLMQGIQVGQTMKQIAGATIESAIAASIYGKNIGQAMKAAAKAVLASVAEQSAAEAIFYTAKGIADSFWNPPAAAADFHAAEMFGALAAGTGVAAAAIPGGGSKRAQGSTGSQYGGEVGSGSRPFRVGSGSSGQQLVPGGNLPPAPKNGNLTISIMGDQEAGQWLANTLNTVVRQGGASLTATHTTAIPNPVA